jgi:hypothetical protein
MNYRGLPRGHARGGNNARGPGFSPASSSSGSDQEDSADSGTGNPDHARGSSPHLSPLPAAHRGHPNPTSHAGRHTDGTTSQPAGARRADAAFNHKQSRRICHFPPFGTCFGLTFGSDSCTVTEARGHAKTLGVAVGDVLTKVNRLCTTYTTVSASDLLERDHHTASLWRRNRPVVMVFHRHDNQSRCSWHHLPFRTARVHFSNIPTNAAAYYAQITDHVERCQQYQAAQTQALGHGIEPGARGDPDPAGDDGCATETGDDTGGCASAADASFATVAAPTIRMRPPASLPKTKQAQIAHTKYASTLPPTPPSAIAAGVCSIAGAAQAVGFPPPLPFSAPPPLDQPTTESTQRLAHSKGFVHRFPPPPLGPYPL